MFGWLWVWWNYRCACRCDYKQRFTSRMDGNIVGGLRVLVRQSLWEHGTSVSRNGINSLDNWCNCGCANRISNFWNEKNKIKSERIETVKQLHLRSMEAGSRSRRNRG